MLRLDSHQHFWDLQRLAYPWLNAKEAFIIRTKYVE